MEPPQGQEGSLEEPVLEVGIASSAKLGSPGHRWQWGLHSLSPTEARPGALVNPGPCGGSSHEATPAVPACALACGALSRMGDGFCLFNFNFAFCGIPELFEIDHPLIG